MREARARVGSPHRHYRSTDSTNQRARELAIAGAPAGTIVTAAEQTAGRGRYGRSWEAPAGKALLYSAILRAPAGENPLLSLLVALASAEAIESSAPVECTIKWPNDLWIEERKVAGILIEARPPHWVVVGIGINVSIEPDEFPDDLRWPAISVGSQANVEDLREALSAKLADWLSASPEDVLVAYRGRDALTGRPVQWMRAEGTDPLPGIAAGVDDTGNLILDGENGRVSIGSGEVQLPKPEDSRRLGS